MDATDLICQTIPAGRGAAPAAPEIPEGPIVQEADGHKNPAPTFEDLLSSPTDERLFDYYFASQLAIISPRRQGHEDRRKGHPLAHVAVAGREVRARLHGASPVFVSGPRGALPGADRGVGPHRQGRAQGPGHAPPGVRAARDGRGRGGPARCELARRRAGLARLGRGARRRRHRAKVPKHDHLLSLPAPFAGTPIELIAVESRIGGGRGGSVTWAKSDLAIVSEASRKSRKARDVGHRSVESVAGTAPHVGAQYRRPLRRSRPLRGHARTVRRQRAPHLEGRQVRVPHGRRVVARGRPSVPEQVRTRDRQDDTALPLGSAVLRERDDDARRRRQSRSSRFASRSTKSPTISFATSRRTSSPSSRTPRIPRPSSRA